VVADVPDEVVTVTSTVPAPAGLGAVIEPVELTVTLDAGLEPKLTVVAPALKPMPATVTAVPPRVLPELGLTEETLGGDPLDSLVAVYIPLVWLLS
jgi:hypothetical protein